MPFALQKLCNGLGTGGCTPALRTANEVMGKRKSMSSLELFLYCARENFGACSKLPCIAAEGAKEKKKISLFKTT